VILLQLQSVSQSVSQLGSVCGLILILYAIFVFDKNTPSPSLYSLIPTIGAGLVLIFANNKNLVGRLLSNKVLVVVGLMSYSAYLWHQPLLAFARLGGIDESNTLLLGLLVLSSILIAYFSWKYVETPFRDKQKISRKTLFSLSILFTITFVSIGLVVDKNNGFNSRLNNQQKAIAEFQNYDFNEVYRHNACFIEAKNTYEEFKDECFGSKTSESYLIWGDSYAAAASVGLRVVYSDTIQLTASACPPLIDTVFKYRPNCLDINNFVKEN